jgi:hypothetical protein
MYKLPSEPVQNNLTQMQSVPLNSGLSKATVVKDQQPTKPVSTSSCLYFFCNSTNPTSQKGLKVLTPAYKQAMHLLTIFLIT